MRRRTNPPPATWVAFGRSARGYKRFAHFRIAVHVGGLRVTVHIEDDSDDKGPFAAALRRDRDALLARMLPIDGLTWYSLPAGPEGPLAGRAMTATHLDQLADSLSRFKTVEFSAGIPFDRDDPRLDASTGLPPLLLASMQQLAPLYVAALSSPG